MYQLKLENTDEVTLIDDDDVEKVINHKWYINKKGYVWGRPINRSQISLHRFLLDLQDQKIEVDHIDRNRLNNQKSNLRQCAHKENCRNKLGVSGTSKYKGVSRGKGVKKWRARIRLNYKNIHIGVFSNEKEAALAYNNKAKELFGEFALLNEVD